MKKRTGSVAMGLAIIFVTFTIVIIFLVEHVSNNFYQTKLQVIETKTQQFTKPFLVSAANIWIQAASQTAISPANYFNVAPGEASQYFTIKLNTTRSEEVEVIRCQLDSKAGLIYDTTSGSKTISIDIKSTMISDLSGFN